MKRSEILGVFFFVSVLVFLGFASAANSCDSSQVILNLSNNQNAHASFYNGNVNYPYAICFNERFTSAFSGATRVCDVARTNGVIGLSALTNAHVEGVLLTNYDSAFDVCYGNLTCNLRQSVNGAVPCLSNEGNMFSVYSITNAHAAKLGYYTYTLCCAAQGYNSITNNNGICESGETADNSCDCAGNCSVGGTTIVSTASVSTVNWVSGAIVAGTTEIINSSYVNNSAYLVANVLGGTDGSSVRFDIYENDSSAAQTVTTVYGNLQGGRAYAEWPITDANIKDGYESGEGTVLEYYFVATYSGSTGSSGLLNVTNVNGPNSIPVASIISPADDSVYFIGETVAFNSGSFDRDGRITSEWNIGDTITGAQKNASSFTYAYTTPGDKIVTLTVVDNDGTTATARVVVSVVSSPGINIHTKINKPYQGEDIFNYTIAYNGSGSWVINITGTSPTINAVCLGGNCPATIGATSVPVTQLTPSLKGNYASMFYSWTYGSDNFLIISQSGFANVTGSRTYSGIGMKKIELNVSAFGVSSKVYNDFTINEPNGCSADGLFIKIGGSRFSTLTRTESVCNLVNPNCCPRVGDYSCEPSGSLSLCQAGNCSTFFTAPGGTTAAITLCDHYNNVTGNKELKCNSDCAGAGASAQQLNFIKSTYGLGGYQINNVRCTWVAEKCDVAFTSSKLDSSVNPPIETFSGCKETIISQSECTEDNYQLVTWETSAIDTSNPNDVARCTNTNTQTVLCGTPVIALPFFTLGNLIVAIILIVLIYLIINYSKKKDVKGKGKRRK